VLVVEIVVVMSVVDGEAVHDLLPVAQPLGQQDVPHTLGAGPKLVAFVMNLRVAVVHLEKLLAAECDQIFDFDRPAEVRVVDMREHGSAGALALLEDGVDVVLHHLADALSSLGLNEVLDVGRVHMNVLGLEPVGDFFGRHEQKRPWLFEEGAVFLESLETHLMHAFVGVSLVNPVGPVREASLVEVEKLRASTFGDVDETFALGERVVLGQRDEVVARGLVPVDDHLRIVIAIAPKRVCVKVAFPPSRHRWLRALGAREPKEQPKKSNDEAKPHLETSQKDVKR
jgi:hypothetical protein